MDSRTRVRGAVNRVLYMFTGFGQLWDTVSTVSRDLGAIDQSCVVGGTD